MSAGDKSIIDVQIDTSAFDAFKAKVDDLQDQLKFVPEEWARSSAQIKAQTTNFEKLHQLALRTKDQAGKVKGVVLDDVPWISMATSGKSMVEHLHHATLSLGKWAGLTTLFSSIMGAGGLMGIDSMARGVANRRFEAAQLGATRGQTSSFEVHLARLGIGPEFMGWLSEMQSDPNKRGDLFRIAGGAAGQRIIGEGSFEGSLDLLSAMKTRVDNFHGGDAGLGQDAASAGIPLELARVLKRMKRSELDTSIQSARDDAAPFNLSDADQRKWQDLTRQFELAGAGIETALINKLPVLIPGITKLTTSFEKLVEKVMDPNGGVVHWMNGPLKTGIDHFDAAISSRTFSTHVDKFLNDAKQARKTIDFMESALAAWGALAAGMPLARLAIFILSKVPGPLGLAVGAGVLAYEASRAIREAHPETGPSPLGGGDIPTAKDVLGSHDKPEHSPLGGDIPTPKDVLKSGDNPRPDAERAVEGKLGVPLVARPVGDLPGANTRGVEPELVEAIRQSQADLPPGWKLRVTSGHRDDEQAPGTRGVHTAGHAVDVKLIDETGAELTNQGENPRNVEAYKRWAASVYQHLTPEEKKHARWGGQYGTKLGGGGPTDLMHFDVGLGREAPASGRRRAPIQEWGGSYNFNKPLPDRPPPTPLSDRTLQDYIGGGVPKGKIAMPPKAPDEDDIAKPTGTTRDDPFGDKKHESRYDGPHPSHYASRTKPSVIVHNETGGSLRAIPV